RQAGLYGVNRFLDSTEEAVDGVTVVLQPAATPRHLLLYRAGIECGGQSLARKNSVCFPAEVGEAEVAEAGEADRAVSGQTDVVIQPDKIGFRFRHCGVDLAGVPDQ